MIGSTANLWLTETFGLGKVWLSQRHIVRYDLMRVLRGRLSRSVSLTSTRDVSLSLRT